MKPPHMQNVILTTLELGGVGWLTSIISEVWNAMHPGVYKLRWRYETSVFEATRDRRPLPEGWTHTFNADPGLLLTRGFDKIMVLQKPLVDCYYAGAFFMHPHKKLEEIEPRYFEGIKRRWIQLEKYRDHKSDNFLFLDINEINNDTVNEFNKILDFLDFPKEGRPMIIPVKVWRNWECYSNIQKSANSWFEEHDPSFNLDELVDRKRMHSHIMLQDLEILERLENND